MGDSDVVAAVLELSALPKDVHWFCPQSDPDDDLSYFEEDVLQDVGTNEEQDRRALGIRSFEARKHKFMKAFDILAYDPGASDQYKEILKAGISEAVLGCGICVREYYRLLSEKRAELEAAFGNELVEEFFLRVDFFNNDRISNRLAHCANQLERLPESGRKLKNLDPESLFAFLEAMASPVYSQNESLLARHFDLPFRLLGGVKKLKPDSYLPAMTSFLFSSSSARVEWAEYNWDRFQRAPTKREFDGAIREPLVAAMSRVQMSVLDRPFLPQFWTGMRIIAAHLDTDLITHSLRGLGGSNVFLLSLEHLHQHLESKSFLDILASINEFLKKAPKVYWDSMGTINPQTVVEQIFVNANMPKLLREDQLEQLGIALEFVQPFIQSLPADKQPSACRTIVQHLLGKWRDRALASDTRRACFNAGMLGMKTSLETLIKSTRVWGEVDPACIAELLNVFHDHAAEISSATKLFTNQVSIETPPALLVVQHAIELDISLLSTAHFAISTKKPLASHHFSQSGQIWPTLIQTVKAGRAQALGTRMLLGSRKLCMIEKFLPTKHAALTKDMIAFNASFDKCMDRVNDVLEAVNDWQPRDINSIFKSAELASGFLATLFYDHQTVRITAVEILKTMGNEEDRRDALRQLLNNAYLSAVSAFAEVISSVVKGRTYGPHSAAIRIMADVLDALCNSQDGLLRSKDLDATECDATAYLWQTLWRLLTSIFDSTEQWSKQGQPKPEMHEFCRDSMQLAEHLYDYHSVLVSSMSEEDANSEAKAETTHGLLEHPNQTMSSMVGWLRLADEFLITKIVTVFNNLLGNLRAAKLTVSKDVLLFVEQLLSNQIKSKLSDQQRGSLMQSLESHGGVKVEVLDKVKQEKSHKQGTLTFQNQATTVIRDNTRASSMFPTLKEQFSKPPAKPIAPVKTSDMEFQRKRLEEKAANAARQAAAADERKKKLAALQLKEQQEKGIMVSSDESDDSSDDGEEEDMDKILFGIKKVNKSRADKKIGDVKVIGIKDQPKGPVKVRKQVRATKDIRARLAPSLTSLHSIILSWEYFHEGSFPPGSDDTMYQQVLAKYPNPVEYKSVFEPLLSLEAWQGFVQAREEEIFKPFAIKVASRSSVDSFVEISTIRHVSTYNKDVMEADIVLLSLSEKPTSNKEVPHCLARVHKITRKPKGEVEIVYRAVNRGPLVRDIRPDLEIWGVKIHSLIPLEREYGVLQSLQYYDLCDYVLAGRPSALLDYSNSSLEKTMSNYNLNKAQSKAVHSAVDNDAFTLIQGPPGSGKTKTIVAIVGALLSDAMTKGQGVGIDKTKKLLVCAPSNAAVDELVMRLKQGVKTTNGKEHKIKVVRVGRGEAINTAVKDVQLDELLKARLNVQSNNGDSQQAEIAKLMTEHKAVSEKLKVARERLETDDSAPFKAEFDVLKKKRMEVGARIDSMKDAEKTQRRDNEIERKKAMRAIIDEAHIVCATLSGSGGDNFQSFGVDFETVVIDEAAQCVEASALIPLKYGCTKCILVGDPKQLPPTVLSKQASRFAYEKSMFVRMQENHPKDVHLLDTQYRMHTEISRFPSSAFYDGRLHDGPNMDDLRKQIWHCAPLLGPYRFFDVQGQQQAGGLHSLINKAEIQVAMQLYDRLLTDFSDNIDFKGKIGIITPYKSQLNELKNTFSRKYGEEIKSLIEFNTTDAFQGREAEIIMFSCVRAAPSGGVGFLSDIRRMNVGLTRAKSSLWVLGNADSLVRGQYWAKLINDAKSRGHFVKEYNQELRRPTPAAVKQEWFNKNGTNSSPAIAQIAKSNQGSMTAAPRAKADPGKAISSRPAGPTGLRNSMPQVSIQPTSANGHPLSPAPKTTPNGHASEQRPRNNNTSDVDMPDAPPIKVVNSVALDVDKQHKREIVVEPRVSIKQADGLSDAKTVKTGDTAMSDRNHTQRAPPRKRPATGLFIPAKKKPRP